MDLILKRVIGILVVLMALGFVGCNDKSKFGFSSKNCDEVYSNCMSKCTKSRSECFDSCAKSRGMCESIKTKGCMQDCNTKYGKGNNNSELCKKRCIDNRGVSF